MLRLLAPFWGQVLHCDKGTDGPRVPSMQDLTPPRPPERPSLLQVTQWIYGRAADPHLEVDVRAEAVARAADVPDRLALRHGAAADREARLVGIGRRQPAAVVDDDQVAVAAHPAGVDDDAGRGRGDRSPIPDGDVDSLVHAAPAPPERAHDGSADRPDQA